MDWKQVKEKGKTSTVMEAMVNLKNLEAAGKKWFSTKRVDQDQVDQVELSFLFTYTCLISIIIT